MDAGRARYFVDYENFAGGHGAFSDRDGMDATQVHMSNTSNLPIEVCETEFPLRIERYEFEENSCGAGQFRSGLGVCRDIRILHDGIALALRSARQRFPANGVRGGMPGAPGRFILNPDTPAERVLPGTASEIALNKGDLLRIVTPGGGGNGEPELRDAAAHEADLRDGRVSDRSRARALEGGNDRHLDQSKASARQGSRRRVKTDPVPS
jgi:N-methylhydantoinase B